MENSINNCNNFISSKDVQGERVIDSRGNNIKFTSYNDANEVVDLLFVQDIKKIQEHQRDDVTLL